MKNYLLLVIVLLGLSLNSAKAQLQAELTIENTEIVNGELLFDIYLRQSGSTTDPIFLAASDFVLQIDTTKFDSPVLTKLDNPSPPMGFQNGYCTFLPFDDSQQTNNLFTQLTYYEGTFLDRVNGDFNLNLNAPFPSNQTFFNERIASIDETASTHRLGRFALSGYLSGDVAINWKTGSQGLVTKIFAYENVAPFNSFEIPVNAVDPPLVQEPVSVKPIVEESWSANLVPNPATTSVRLELSEIPTEEMSYEIFDAIGRNRQTGIISSATTTITLNNLAPGLYWVRLKTESGKTKSYKLIKLAA